MRIKRLDLANYRPFDRLGIEFGEHLTVLVGVNGAGKTSILDCLVSLLSHMIAKVRSAKGSGRSFVESDIHLGASETYNTIEVEFRNQMISWWAVKTRPGRPRREKTNLNQLKGLAKTLQSELETNENACVPLVVYYGVNRAVLDIPLRIRKKHQFDQLAAYEQAVTGARNSFRLFFEWFRGREDIENEWRLYSVEDVPNPNEIPQGKEYRDPQLQAVREAIQALSGFSNLRVNRSPLRMEVRKGDRHLNVGQLSDGEKCLLALAGDLARRLAIANPAMKKPLAGEGIVLIDEVDLHLHPEWQHQVIPKLRETFPHCQFILTTHSPQVLSHVQCRDIWCLVEEDGETAAIRPDGTYGQDSNFLLKTLFNSNNRPEIIDRDIQRLFELIQEDAEGARRLLDDLKNRVEGESPDLVRAETLLHYREAPGR
jgi:predicted ATP-binding protein involved in virulence